MTQEAIQISETPPLPGLKLVQDTNKAFQTIATDFAGPTDPAGLDGCGPYCKWADTANGLLKRRNAANTGWEVEGKLFVDGSKAENIDYEDPSAGLGATDVQAAISEAVGLFPFRGIQVYDTAGTYTWNVPAGVTKAWVIVTGGGGAAGVGQSSGSIRGAGGGAGGTAMKLVDLTGVTSVTVTVGAGGIWTSRNGKASSFGAYCSATGGEGGGDYTGSTAAGGLAGSAFGGDLNLPGGDGSDAPVQNGSGVGGSGDGGASYWGGGQRSAGGTGFPQTKAPGSGAGGTETSSNSGASGIVIIQW